MNGVLRIMVWFMSFVTTESLSEVFWRNRLGTISYLIQFKSAPISNKTIVSSL
jgi:hypothetical protein